MTLEYVGYVWLVLMVEVILGILCYLRFWKLCKSNSKASLSTFFLLLLLYLYFFFHCCIDVNARCFLYPASINEMPTPASVFVFIRTSYKIFYNPFRMIKVKLTYSRYSLFHHHQSHSTNKVKNQRGKRRWIFKRSQIDKVMYGDSMFVALWGEQIWRPAANKKHLSLSLL